MTLLSLRCEGLADIIWTMRQQVKQLQDINSRMREDDPHMASAVISELLSEFTELLSNLVSGTFVIEKQPPQVMKTNTRFTSTVRLLVGGVLNVHMAAPQVSRPQVLTLMLSSGEIFLLKLYSVFESFEDSAAWE